MDARCSSVESMINEQHIFTFSSTEPTGGHDTLPHGKILESV
jgi:hypothetical protein